VVPASTTPVSEGEVLTYTLTFSSIGQAPVAVDYVDDLTRVLDDATVTTPPALASGSGLTLGPIVGGTFAISGVVDAGATATITFSVTVNTPDTGDRSLDNFLVPTGTTPPAQCLSADPTCTTNPVLEASLGVGAGDVSRTEPLARTGAGAALGRMLEVGALLVLAGAAMVTFGRRRGRRPSSPAAR
jgi:hypothetical protein